MAEEARTLQRPNQEGARQVFRSHRVRSRKRDALAPRFRQVEAMTEFPVIENAVVGQWYTVPCVTVKTWGAIPIHGPWHEDEKYIGFKRHHFHVDWRFASPRYRAFVMDHMDTFAPKHAPLEQLVHNRVICEMITKPVLRRRICQRVMPDFPNAKF